jgi:hypothetical protein
MFVCLRLVSCVPSVASFSGLSILDYPFGFFYSLFVLKTNLLVKQRDVHLQFLLDDSEIFMSQCVAIYYVNQVHIHFLFNYEIQMSVIDNPQLYLSILSLKNLL